MNELLPKYVCGAECVVEFVLVCPTVDAVCLTENRYARCARNQTEFCQRSLHLAPLCIAKQEFVLPTYEGVWIKSRASCPRFRRVIVMDCRAGTLHLPLPPFALICILPRPGQVHPVCRACITNYSAEPTYPKDSGLNKLVHTAETLELTKSMKTLRA